MKLLIIDDEPDMVEVLASQIECLGLECQVLTATTVDEAERQITECDAILSDINMPQRERLESLLRGCGKPVARITGNADPGGGGLCLPKPFRVSEFAAVIARLQDQVGSRRK